MSDIMSVLAKAASKTREWLGADLNGSAGQALPPHHSAGRRAELKRWVEFYRAFTEMALPGFPAQQAVHLESASPEQRPLIRTFLPRGAVPDRYAGSFEKCVRLLGQDISRTEEAITGERILLVDIRERTGRRPNECPGALEIAQAIVWLGLDYFVHIRPDAVRKTVRYCDRLQSTAESFADELSQMTALALIADQLTGVPLELPLLSMSYDQQYFGTGLLDFGPDEVIVDAGAANGDSLVKYRQLQPAFAGYHAFEPDPVLGKDLREFVAREYPNGKVHVSQVPLADRSGPRGMKFIPGSGNTRMEAESADQLVASSIDDYLAGGRATVIKMDVEGAELQLLKGAAATIRKHRPKLLISVYHEIEHLFQVPEFIFSLRSDYKFYMRNHTWATENDSWPGSFFCETVLYAA